MNLSVAFDTLTHGKLPSHLTKIFQSFWHFTDIVRLSSVLNEEINLPYEFDVIDYNSIDSKELKEHIDSFCASLWEHK